MGSSEFPRSGVPMYDKKYYTIKECVEMGLGSRTTLWRRIHVDGTLPAIKIGGRVLIPADGLERYVAECRVAGE